jgi:hypothetical protein
VITPVVVSPRRYRTHMVIYRNRNTLSRSGKLQVDLRFVIPLRRYIYMGIAHCLVAFSVLIHRLKLHPSQLVIDIESF